MRATPHANGILLLQWQPTRKSGSTREISLQAPHLAASLLSVLERLQPVTGGFPQVLDAAYRKYAENVGMRLYGDKSATFEPENLVLYDSTVDNLRVIHVIRDGRDVYCSWRAQWFGPRTVAEAAWLWRRHIESRRAWAQSNKDRYLEIRYEDFIANPRATLANLAALLGLPEPHPNAIELANIVSTDEPQHRKLAQPIDPNNTGQWRTLPPNDIRLFEFIAGDTLQELRLSGFAHRGWVFRTHQYILSIFTRSHEPDGLG